MRLSIAALLIANLALASPSSAAVDCLDDDEVRALVRSAYTRSIGRVMRLCADRHSTLDDRAQRATYDFLTVYADDMRANRMATRALLEKAFAEKWEAALEKLTGDTVAGDEVWARIATLEECRAEVATVERLVAEADYERVMTNERTQRLFAAERAAVPRCEP